MKITIYTITDCQFSKQEKEYLTAHTLPFEEKNLETNHEYLTEMLNVSNNFAGTPVTKLEKDDGTIVVLKGFTAEEFDKELGFKKEEKKADDVSAETKTPDDQKETKPEEQPKEVKSQQVAPPPQPPGIPAPQPPTPTPQPPAPQPPNPETPIAPPTISDHDTQPMNMNTPPDMSMNMPQRPMNEPIAMNTNEQPLNNQPQQQVAPMASNEVPATDSTIDDASLDAILNQLQEKTAAPANQDQPQTPQTPPPSGNTPSIPDFGGNN